MERTQLNVSIDPNLLEKIRENAKRSGKTLNRFVSDCFINQLEELEPETIEYRFNRIEDRIQCIEEILHMDSYESKKTKLFTPGDAKNFNEFIKAIFKKELKRRQYKSTKDAWNDFIKHLNCFDQWNEVCSIRLKESLFIEHGDPLSCDEMNSLQNGEACPSPIRTGIINWINNSKQDKCCCSYKDFPSQRAICEEGSTLVKDL